MAPLKRMPPLPKSVFSPLGPLSVTLIEGLVEAEEAVGMVNFRTRTIELDSGCTKEALWVTLFHEMAHVALRDGGATEVLGDQQEEAVCNALGSYLAAMVKAGCLKLSAPPAE